MFGTPLRCLLEPIVILGAITLLLLASPLQAQHELPSPLSAGALSEMTEEAYGELSELSIRFMLRGYVHARSSLPDRGLGGFGESRNAAWPIPPEITLESEGVQLLALPESRVSFAREYKGMRLLIANTGDTNLEFDASDGRLYVIQEALDESGEWRFIEYLPSSMCGNSHHRVFLKPGECWINTAPRYHGTHKTKLRFRLIDTRWRSERNYYSNEFDGSVNPEQFSVIRPYSDRKMMGPYPDIPEQRRYGIIDENGEMITSPRYEAISHSRAFDRQPLITVKRNGKWGVVDRRGRVVADFVYDKIERFVEGRAAVNVGAALDWSGSVSGGKWGFIDTTGKLVVEPKYDDVSEYFAGMSIVRQVSDGESRAGVIGLEGEEILPVDFEGLESPLQEAARYGPVRGTCGRFFFFRRDHRWGVIDVEGNVLVEPIIQRYGSMYNGMTSVFVEGRSSFVDCSGRLLESRFHEAHDFTNGFAAVRLDGAWGMIDRSGRMLIEPAFTNLGERAHRLVTAKLGDRWGFVDTAGTVVIPFRYKSVMPFVDSTAIVTLDSQQVLIDRTGMVVSGAYDKIERLYDGLLKITRSGKSGVMTTAGSVLVEPRYDYVWDSGNPVIVVVVEKRYGLIDRQGRELQPPSFDDITGDRGSSEMAFKRDGKWGAMDGRGAIVLEPAFDKVRIDGSRRWVVTVESRMGIVDRSGNYIVPPMYDYIGPFIDGTAIVSVSGGIEN